MALTDAHSPLPVLIVDDEPIILDMIRAVLEEDGLAVLTARGGNSALEIAQQTLPSLILTDFMMPDMNGIDLARQLRADPRTAAIPLILMSAAMPAGSHDLFVTVIQKPFLIDELVAKVCKWLQP